MQPIKLPSALPLLPWQALGLQVYKGRYMVWYMVWGCTLNPLRALLSAVYTARPSRQASRHEAAQAGLSSASCEPRHVRVPTAFTWPGRQVAVKAGWGTNQGATC